MKVLWNIVVTFLNFNFFFFIFFSLIFFFYPQVSFLFFLFFFSFFLLHTFPLSLSSFFLLILFSGTWSKLSSLCSFFSSLRLLHWCSPLFFFFSFFFFFFVYSTSALFPFSFSFFLFFSSSTPLVLSSLLFFSFFLFLFVYSRAEDLSFFLPLTQTNSLSYTHISPAEKWRSAFYTDRRSTCIFFFVFLFWFD